MVFQEMLMLAFAIMIAIVLVVLLIAVKKHARWEVKYTLMQKIICFAILFGVCYGWKNAEEAAPIYCLLFILFLIIAIFWN